MKILSRHILRTHIGPFFFGSMTVMFLFLFQFVMLHLDQLVGKGLSYWVITRLIGLNLAWMVVLAVPMGVLFSTLMAFGGMSASHEVTIIKASGGSLLKMMLPVVIAGMITTAFLFWFNDRVLPEANHQAKVLLNDINRKKPTFSIEAGQFSTQLEGYIILSRQLDSVTGILKGVTVYDNTKGKRLNIASADTGIIEFSPDYTKIIMNMYNGEIHQFTQDNLNNYHKIDFHRYQILMPATGFNLENSNASLISRGDREMRIIDMEKIVNESVKNANVFEKKIKVELEKHYKYLIEPSKNDNFGLTQFSRVDKKAGINQAVTRINFLNSMISPNNFQKNDYMLKAQQYEVEIQKKYSIPFACLIFVLVGCPLGIMTRGGNFGLSAAISLGFYIFYWASLIGGEKFADRGLISPYVSMWGGNFIIAALGIILTIKVNNESIGIPKFRIIRKLFSSDK